MMLTRHPRHRIQQRGYKKSDVHLIVEHGTQATGAVVLRTKDVDRVEAQLKQRISRVRTLQGSAVILRGETIVSIYRAGKQRRRRLLAEGQAS